MTKQLRNTFYSLAWVGLLWLNKVTNAVNYGLDKVRQDTWSTETADQAIQTLIARLLMFLWVIAVWFIIYAGFLILTAGWDEEKVKKGKTIMIQAVIWIIVIFLAYSIVNWIFSFITN